VNPGKYYVQHRSFRWAQLDTWWKFTAPSFGTRSGGPKAKGIPVLLLHGGLGNSNYFGNLVQPDKTQMHDHFDARWCSAPQHQKYLKTQPVIY
jgi:pimeloyl-ACP methyl ester carboxylesterase